MAVNAGVMEMRVLKRKLGGTIDEAESQNKKAGDQIQNTDPGMCMCTRCLRGYGNKFLQTYQRRHG